jgi:hypothetical protein
MRWLFLLLFTLNLYALEMGVDIYNELKTKDGIFVDKTTNFIWQDNPAAKNTLKSWYEAKKYCHDLELNGFNDWMLPSKKELLTLYQRKDELRYQAPSFYWSASSGFYNTEDAWYVLFYNAYSNYYFKEFRLFTCCIRQRKVYFLNFPSRKE